jgi:hypothetical protein
MLPVSSRHLALSAGIPRDMIRIWMHDTAIDSR